MLGKIAALFKPPVARERDFYRRLLELNADLERAPNSLCQLVLRGELYLARGEQQRADADFRAALACTEGSEGRGWGILEQVMRDRAWRGLQTPARPPRHAAPTQES